MRGAIDRPAVLKLGPRSVERPADAGATLVAGIDGHNPVLVDGGGLVSPTGPLGADRTWSLDWWIGADDRWHVPAREPTIRQRRVGQGPIVETSLRVPSGDVVHTVYPAVVGVRAVTVIEIRNDSPVPVALALAVRPYTVHGSPGPVGLELPDDGRRLAIDGKPVIVLPRRPNESGAMTDGDLLEAVQAGHPLSWSGTVSGPWANAVCLYPLPHKTSLRFAVEPDPRETPGAAGPLDPGALPDSASVAKGWTAVIERAARFEFPDSGVTALAGAARARLMLAAPGLPAAVVGAVPGAGLILEGLAAGGHRFECLPAVEAFAGSFPTELPHSAADAAAVVNGIALAAQLLGDDRLDQDLLEPMAQLTRLVERSGGRRSDNAAGALARSGLARLVESVGQHDAAAKLRKGGITTQPVDLDELMAWGERAAPAGRWNGPTGPLSDSAVSDSAAFDSAVSDSAVSDSAVFESAVCDSAECDSADLAARYWIAARRLLIRERQSDDGGSTAIELLPDFPTAWLGGTVEVHQAPVAGHRVSFAIRWHGYRPAMLWDIEGDGHPVSTDSPQPVLTCPGLDSDWRGDQPRGEALLAGSAEALPDSPEPGDSFQ